MKTTNKGWLPVIGLTLSTFIFNTSEFIPIGLLSGIASDFAISESQAGLLITVYAWVVAIASLPLMLVFAKTENRRLMLSIVALFVFSHILSGVAANYNISRSPQRGAWRSRCGAAAPRKGERARCRRQSLRCLRRL